MKKDKNEKYVKVQNVGVGKGMSGTAPEKNGGSHPRMETHLTIKFECDECDIVADMSMDVATRLSKLLSANI